MGTPIITVDRARLASTWSSSNFGNQTIGTFDQHFTFIGYKATMDIGAWQGGPLDRRLAFAAALLLMAIEAKEDASR